jgi:hypothetical protein
LVLVALVAAEQVHQTLALRHKVQADKAATVYSVRLLHWAVVGEQLALEINRATRVDQAVAQVVVAVLLDQAAQQLKDQVVD